MRNLMTKSQNKSCRTLTRYNFSETDTQALESTLKLSTSWETNVFDNNCVCIPERRLEDSHLFEYLWQKAEKRGKIDFASRIFRPEVFSIIKVARAFKSLYRDIKSC